jgi:hypothetical protein
VGFARGTVRLLEHEARGDQMPHHEEKSASALARGPAKPGDIERARRDIGTTDADSAIGDMERAVGEVEAACRGLRDDLSTLKRAPGPT